MVKTLLRGLAPATLCAAMLAAQADADAQTPAPAARPDPLNAQAGVPALVYRSSLPPARPADRPADASPTVGWRDANDTVGRIGGWRSYAREAQAPTPAQPASGPALPAAQPGPAGMPGGKPMPMHHGHHRPHTP